MQTRSNEVYVPLELMNNDEYWRYIFGKYDRNGDGHICLREFDDMLNSTEYDHDIPERVVKKIHKLADTNGDGKLDFNEFLKLVKSKDFQQKFKTLVNGYVHILLPPTHPGSLQVRFAGQYEEEYSCCPPPIGMMVISIIIVIFYWIDVSKSSPYEMLGPIGTVLVYNPFKRYEVWRFITYMFVHLGAMHLVVNLCVQILLGVPLEMVHKWWRVWVVYFSGVIAGSLGTSITDPAIFLAGASGGVYAIITAHIASIVMNWKEMQYAVVQLLIFLIITVCDLGTAIYNRYILNLNNGIGYTAHIAGALAGLLVGINVLRNIEVTKLEKVIRWITLILYAVLMGGAIIWNVCFRSYFPHS